MDGKMSTEGVHDMHQKVAFWFDLLIGGTVQCHTHIFASIKCTNVLTRCIQLMIMGVRIPIYRTHLAILVARPTASIFSPL